MTRRASASRSIVVAILGCLTTLILLTALPAPAQATRLSEDKARAAEIADEIAALDDQLAEVVAAYEAVSAELAAVKERISTNRERLDTAEAELAAARELAGERAVAMYKERPLSLVDVIVGSNDFGDLVAQVQFLVKLGQHDQGIVDDLETSKKKVEKRRRELLADREAAETALKRKDKERTRVKEALAERQSTLSGLRAEIEELEARLREPVVQSTPVAVADAGSSSSGSSGSSGATPSGGWWPLIQQAAAANGVDPNGMYRLMMSESSGNPNCIGFGLYHGLFQYSPSLWASSWNPYRSSSIYDGAAQIQATALAIKMGKGPHWWPNTYGPAFGG